MKRYILSGTPGSGKTSLIRALEMTGASVVNEAATDVISYQQAKGIAKPWEQASFIDEIIALQQHRQIALSDKFSALHFYDRSPICTFALACYLKRKPSVKLMNEIDRIKAQAIYEKNVFFIENLGFIENTAARQINFEQALDFERMHKAAYEQFGFTCKIVKPASIEERCQMILAQVKAL